MVDARRAVTKNDRAAAARLRSSSGAAARFRDEPLARFGRVGAFPKPSLACSPHLSLQAAHTAASTFDPVGIAAGDTDLFVVAPEELLDHVRGWTRTTIPSAVPARRALERDLLVVLDEMPRLADPYPFALRKRAAAGARPASKAGT